MMLAEEIQTTFEIDKSSWTKVKLGDVIREVRETVKDPIAEGIERIVGLEHLESESLHIRAWGTLTDGTTFTKVFRKGQVLFGRRRAYLRKAALATFDGICSGDITVLEAKKGLLPELLPFLIQNEKFFELAVKNSAGSLSPRAKFADFADYEFLLPPIDQQEQIDELLWAGDDELEKKYILHKMLTVLFESTRNNFIRKGGENWPTMRVKDVATVIGGFAFKSERFQPKGEYQVLRISNVGKEDFELEKNPVYIDCIERKEEKYIIPQGAIVISLTGTNGKRDYGFTNFKDNSSISLLNQRLAMVTCDKSIILPEFLFILTKMELFQNQFFLNATGTANQANVSTNDILNIKLPVPSLVEQEEIINQLNKAQTAAKEANKSVKINKQLLKSLINQIY